jgi:hypothetical protein
VISRYVASLLLAGAALAVACIDMSAPSGPASISELQLPSPSVVVNDTMRDIAGNAAPIRVIAFDINNMPIPNVNTELFITDSLPAAHFTADAKLVGGNKVGSVNIIGQVNQLQTPGVVVPVTYRPTTVTASPVLPLAVPLSGDSTQRGSTAISVTVSGGKDSASQGIIVRYVIDSAPPYDDPRFPAVYFTNGVGGKPSSVDTTKASGLATRQLSASAVQFKPGALPAGQTDTVFVTVSVRYAGKDVPGSPVSVHVPIQLLLPTSTSLVPLRRPTTGDILAPVRSQRGNRWARAVVPEIQRPAR